jgi:hypothetical protein
MFSIKLRKLLMPLHLLFAFAAVVLTIFSIAGDSFAAPPGLSGDFSDDGIVNEADYVVWRSNEALNNPLPNDSGLPTQTARFTLWRANFGNSAGGSGGAPSLETISGGLQANGHLNAAGNWLWKVRISTSNPIPTGSSPLAAAIGFKALGSNLIKATNLSSGAGDDFDTFIPSTPIFGWENPGTGTNGFPEGLQSNCASGLCTENTPGDDPNTVFAALGSRIYSMTGFNDFIEIETKGPAVGRLTTQIVASGAYGGKGRIAEFSAFGPPVAYDVYSDTFTLTATAGDSNLDGFVDIEDFNAWSSNAGTSNVRWQDGDFNDDEAVDHADLRVLLDSASLRGDYNFDGSVDAADYVVWRKGILPAFVPSDYDNWRQNFGESASQGAGSGGAVPEPAAVTLSLMTLLSAFYLRSWR